MTAAPGVDYDGGEKQSGSENGMFQGYRQETLDFLWGIRFNNDRTWFQAHKEEYLRCL